MATEEKRIHQLVTTTDKSGKFIALDNAGLSEALKYDADLIIDKAATDALYVKLVGNETVNGVKTWVNQGIFQAGINITSGGLIVTAGGATIAGDVSVTGNIHTVGSAGNMYSFKYLTNPTIQLFQNATVWGFYNGLTATNAISFNNADNFIGIGTATPTRPLSVSKAKAAEYVALLQNTAADGHGLLITVDNVASTSYAVKIDTGFSAGIFAIRGDGKTGIGHTAPSFMLHVKATIPSNVISGFYNDSSTGFGVVVQGGTGTSLYAFQVRDYAGQNRFTIMGGGNVGIGTSTPPRELAVAGVGNFTDGGSLNSLGVELGELLDAAPVAAKVPSIIATANSGWGHIAGSLIIQPRVGVNATMNFYTEGVFRTEISAAGKFRHRAETETQALQVVRNLATEADSRLSMWLVDTEAHIKFYEVADAAAGHGQMFFELDALPGWDLNRGGYIFEDGNGARMMVIENYDGSVGIGVASHPTLGRLQVEKSGELVVALRNFAGTNSANTAVIKFMTDATTNYSSVRGVRGTDSAKHSLVFSTADSGLNDIMWLHYNQNIGIGTPAPVHKLQVITNLASNYVGYFLNSHSTGQGVFIETNGGSGSLYGLQIYDDSVEDPIFEVFCDGTISADYLGQSAETILLRYTASGGAITYPTSDRRLKMKIRKFNVDALDILKSFMPKTFEMKADPDRRRTGWIAQEGFEFIPDMFPIHPRTEKHLLAEPEILPYYHKAIIELLARIEALEAK